jgi:hypothetical protein
MATGILPGQRYSPESPPTPGETGFESKLVEYLKREYGRIADALIGASVFNFEPQFVAIPGAQVPKTNEGDVAYADGTSWNPGEGEGLYLRQNGAWRKLNADQASIILKGSTTPTPTAEGEIWWDTDDNIPVIGDGANSRRFSPWELITSIQIPSSTASITWTGLSSFRRLKFEAMVRPATDGVATSLRTSTNNGSSYDSGATDYLNYYLFSSNGGAASVTVSNSDRMDQAITAIGNVSGSEGIAYNMEIFEFNQAKHCYVYGMTYLVGVAPTNNVGIWGGRRNQSTARDALEFKFTSGNIADGWVALHGIRG